MQMTIAQALEYIKRQYPDEYGDLSLTTFTQWIKKDGLIEAVKTPIEIGRGHLWLVPKSALTLDKLPPRIARGKHRTSKQG